MKSPRKLQVFIPNDRNTIKCSNEIIAKQVNNAVGTHIWPKLKLKHESLPTWTNPPHQWQVVVSVKVESELELKL